MRLSAFPRLLVTIMALTGASGVMAQAEQPSPIPPKRIAFGEGVDLVGRDLQKIFDTDIEACIAACLDTAACTAVTFNSRNGSCFPKADVTGSTPFNGAFSGLVLAQDPKVLAKGIARAKAAGFLGPDRIEAARRQAEGFGQQHETGLADINALRTEFLKAVAQGDTDAAQRLGGALIVLTDAADLWVDYARRALETEDSQDEAAPAAVNGYLRAMDDATAAEALVVLSQAFEQSGATRDTIPALTLAAQLSNREDIQAALDDAIGKYGFRITGNRVEADGAAPRICADFSQDLARSGVDYASFVQLPAGGLSVEPEGSQICIGGLERGTRYTVTFRKGLPSATGETLVKSVPVTGYVRDRAPQVSFAGQAYILPRGADQGLPVQTVNLEHLDLRILKVSDRNLVAAIREGFMGRPLDHWDMEQLSDQMAQTVWTGTADVKMEVNREITTRLPVQDVTGALGPGVYALEAKVPGADPYEHPAATQWFSISDLGMATWSGTDGLSVAVRHLSDASAARGVKVELVSRANEVLGTVQTDPEGVAHFGPALALRADNGAPAMVSVSEGDDMSFLSLTDAEFDLSDRGVTGLPPAPPIDLFLTTDRGAYRAGETIHATMLARDTEVAALSGVPLTAVLIRPDGVEYRRTLTTDAGAGGHVVDFALGANVPRGTWRLDVHADPKAAPLASAKLLVEDFLPERIDFDLTMTEGVLPVGDLPQIGLDARYLFGAPGADLGYEGDIRLSATTALPGFEGYRFGRYDEEAPKIFGTIDSGVTDADGKAEVPLALPEEAAEIRQPLNGQFTVRVREGSGRPVEREVSRTLMPEAVVLGIKPAFADSLPEGATARFSLIALGPEAKPVAQKAHWRVNRIERTYQWYALDGSWSWEPTVKRTRVAEGDAALSPSGATEISAKTTWGEYELIVEAGTGSDYTASSVSFEAGWFAPADTVASPDRLELSLDKPGYKAGETAHLRIVPAADGVALVSVLSNRVIAMKAVPVKAGENVIDLPVTDEWGGGAYVTAMTIRPLDAPKAPARAPVRALGLSYASVDPGARLLHASFDMPDASEPRAAMPVALRVEGAKAGDVVHATISATDVGILNLTAFKSPDPVGAYFGQRRLGVGLRDLYGRLIDGRAGVAGAIRSGGDASMSVANAPPPTEELVAYFSGPLTADKDGIVHASFDMPAFNGTVRLNAVVWTTTAVGQANKDVLVRDPVVVTASVPRFMAPGDTSRALLEIVHARGPAGQMALQVSSDGLATGDVPATVTLKDQGKAVVTVPISAPMSEGVKTLSVVLTTPDGKRLEKTLTIPVERNDPAIARQSRFDLAAGKTFTLDANLFAGLVAGTGHATVAAGPIARFNTPALLAALDRYPYGCTEQITSKAMPLLYLSSVAEAMDLVTPADLPARIDSSIAAILTNQDSSGAFGLWSPESGDGWLDAYVTDFLSRARKAGYKVPDLAFRQALDNLRNQVNAAPDFDATSNGGGGLVAYQLMVLAREGAAAIGDLRYYADVKGDDFATPIAAAQLGAALAAYGDPTRADAMFARAGRMIAKSGKDSTHWRDDYGTNLRDMAAVLTLASEAGSTAIDRDKIGATLSDRIGATQLSTQEASWSLLAASAMIDRPGAEGLTMNGIAVKGPVAGVFDAQAAEPIAISNTGTKPQVLTLTTTGVPEVAEPAGGTGWSIRRSYFTMEGEPVDPAKIAQGTRLVAIDDIRPHGRQEARLMVNDPLPAGFEIDNPNLLRAGDLASLDWIGETADTRMTEFRQDRFLAALDWQSDAPFRLAYIVRAVSPGTFHLPAPSVEDMYRPDQRAHGETGTVVIE
ncbi:hypothetical protein CG50_09795 [Paenirhodobacter enshiensis]|uniref:PAN domain-containing protein n=2 Tax=Paenirhodobacter enshiensis TaxID=1105367 RepID=A0A086XR69_9RHOB|nr:alpha-2-macroglobulin family protein [Paenirhodobacter enshiensis]KFI24519.1 hypothetical protein CG50_09795 [Paenirhodobacter enshiensis]